MIDIIILSIVVIIGSVGALEFEKGSLSISSLWVATISIGLIFLTTGAIYAGVFQLLLYGGVLIVLFMTFSSLMEKEEMEESIDDTQEGDG